MVNQPILSKERKDLILKFLKEEQKVITEGTKKGKFEWKKIPIKKLSGIFLCKDSDGNPLFQYTDGKQRTGFTIKSSEQFGHVKGQMINNWVKQIDFLTAIAKVVFNSDNLDSDNVLSI
ncbi:hypothetical protein LCGC14_0225510 [marine sediment metagenome]|uniref:Uncharacterized protein n=1 Tax=marine sediment metagenome TaxID=412755 RepID=A0A0F9UU18_9ZZZZ